MAFGFIRRFRNWLREIREDVKAGRRGETRVAPRGISGRVYAGPNEGLPPVIGTKGTARMVIKPSRVWSDADKKWYSVEDWHRRSQP